MLFTLVATLAVIGNSLGELIKANEDILQQCSSSVLPVHLRRSCGLLETDETDCLRRGCCWSDKDTEVVAHGKKGTCFEPRTFTTGYRLARVHETATGLTGTLSLLNSNGTSTYGPDIQSLSLEVVMESEDIIRVKITDSAHSRWEVPESLVPRPHATSKPTSTNYKFSYQTFPFSFEVIRISDGYSMFALDSSHFIFKDQYIEVSTKYDSAAKTFGLGESARTNHALETNRLYTMWAEDLPAMFFHQNLYGSYPYYLQVLNGKAHGVMLMNSNGMDVHLEDSAVTFKTIGGIVDLYIFNGPSPSEVVSQYTSIVGRPAMMPYWSLGFHNCKYGYKSLQQVEEVVANYSAANIPLDTQWVDIDYMQNYRDFTWDSVNFPQAEVAKFVDKLHANGQHFVPIVDPAIAVKDGYSAYEEGVKQDVFIKDIAGGYYLGQVWPGPTYFPDFFNPQTQSYWTNQVKEFYDGVPVDGLWIDMNEASNFCNDDGLGQVCTNSAPGGCPVPGESQIKCCLECKTIDTINKYEYPPYAISSSKGRLSRGTIDVTATQYGGVAHYDAHNLYGLSEQIATRKALIELNGKRPFVLSRSSFMSTGVHSAKWTGDNAATWRDLKASIVGAMDMNLMGVPMVGSDICGFIYNTTEELCARWIEVGAFYPFSRDHNDLDQKPQELYLWETVATAARNALGMRYQLLPYMYTTFYNAHTSGETVARALWMNFPEDANTVTIDSQFMLGSGLLISPVLEKGSESVEAYFPQGLWYNFSNRALDVDASVAPVKKAIYTPLTSINVHVKGGTVLPLQQSAMTTTIGRKTPFTLLAALCPGGKAFGDLFWDDGEQLELTHYLTSSFVAEYSGGQGRFTSTIPSDSYGDAKNVNIETISILSKVVTRPKFATLNGFELSEDKIAFDITRGSIEFINLSIPLNTAINLEWN